MPAVLSVGGIDNHEGACAPKTNHCTWRHRTPHPTSLHPPFFFFFSFFFLFFRPRRILRAWHDGVGAAAWHGQRKT